LAVESIDSYGNLSEFTNRSNMNHEGKTHQNVFVMPGGQKSEDESPTEYVGTSGSGDHFWGTSFSAAYASGLIAALWAHPSYDNQNSLQFLDHLKQNTDRTMSNFNNLIYGNGMLHFT